MKRKLFAGVLSIVLLLTTFPIQQATATSPHTGWNKIKDVIIADAVGAIDGYLSSETGWGALLGGIIGSLATIEGPGTGVTGWEQHGEVNELSIGYHHNMALKEVLNALSGQDIHTEQADELINAYLDKAYENFVRGKKGYDHYLNSMGYDYYRSRSMDPTFDATMKRIEEALKNGRISEQFYSNLQDALAILAEDTDSPQILIDKATPWLYKGIVSDLGNSITRGETLLLDFEKIKIVYEPQKTVSDTMDIVVLVPGRSGLAPQVEAMDIILATIFEDVLRHSYDYWSFVFDTSPITLVLTLNSKGVLSNGVQKTLDVAPIARNGRTLVPFRFIGEELGAEISWDQSTEMVSYILGDATIQLWIGKNQALVNGKAVPVDVNPSIVPIVISGRTLVPFRFIGEALGFLVGYDEKTEQVSITGNPLYEDKGVPRTNPLYEGN